MTAAALPQWRSSPGLAGTGPVTPAPRLLACELGLGYADRLVVHGVDLAIPARAFTVIVGANASGKSTLLRGLARLLPPRTGSVLLDGQDLHRRPTKEVARRLGLLAQSPLAPAGITVTDLVARGRAPHQRWWAQWSDRDEEAVAEALRLTGVRDLAHRPVDELSGGQRQRVWIALTLAQQTEVLLLDEPTTYLDLAHQVEVLDLVAQLRQSRACTVVAVLHDLNQASRYADHVVAVRDGRVVAEGPPEVVMTPDVLFDVFGLAATVVPCPVTGRPLVVPRGRPPVPATAAEVAGPDRDVQT